MPLESLIYLFPFHLSLLCNVFVEETRLSVLESFASHSVVPESADLDHLGAR